MGRKTGKTKDSRSVIVVPDESPEAKEELERIRAQIDGRLRRFLDVFGGDVRLHAVPNPDYNSRSDPPADEYLYTDPQGIGRILEEYVQFFREQLQRPFFPPGTDGLLLWMLYAETDVNDDLGFARRVSLQELVRLGITHISLEEVQIMILTCAYLQAPPDERPSALLDFMLTYELCPTSLRGMQNCRGEELPGWSDFVRQWTLFLLEEELRGFGDRGLLIRRLIPDAMTLHPDAVTAVDYAARSLPYFQQYLERILDFYQVTSQEKLTAVYVHAVQAQLKYHATKKRTALEAAEYLLSSEHPDRAALDDCYAAAFDGDASGVSYLRALLGARWPAAMRERLREPLQHHLGDHLERLDLHSRCRKWVWLQECTLLFLEGDFKRTVSGVLAPPWRELWFDEECLLPPILALILLCLCADESLPEHIDQGLCPGLATLTRPAGRALNCSLSEALEQPALPQEKPSITDDDHALLDALARWRAITPISPMQREVLLRGLGNQIDDQVVHICDRRWKSDYPLCAAWLAALGEVRESLGQEGAKQELMEAYHRRYLQRRTFNDALESYGWKRKNRKRKKKAAENKDSADQSRKE